MITVACVEWGDYQGRGAQYVRALQAMVEQWLDVPHRFVCLTDDAARHDPGIETVPLEPGLPGWWNKVQLFRPGLFEGRVLFFDLDTIVVGPLGELATHKGIINLLDWGWTKAVYGSGVMVWDAGEHADIWARFDAAAIGRYHGDQDWITELGGWPHFPAQLTRSFRYHCRERVPRGCNVVCFHGNPKPHGDLGNTACARELQRIWQERAA